jgi:hypothetical protein
MKIFGCFQNANQIYFFVRYNYLAYWLASIELSRVIEYLEGKDSQYH